MRIRSGNPILRVPDFLLARLPLIAAFAAAMALSFAWTGAAMPADEPWNAPPFSADAAALYKAATALPVPDGSDVLIVLDEVRYALDADGKNRYSRRLVFRVLTQAGADDMATVRASWAPWHEERPQIRARVIAADGSVHPLDPATLAESGTDSNQQAVFTDQREISGPLPAIAPGVLVEEEFVTQETKPLFSAGVVRRIYLGNSEPTHRSRLVVDAPASLPLRYRSELLPRPDPVRRESAGRVELVFEAGPLDPWPDVEPYMPPESPRWPVVQFSTGTTWQAVASEYSQVIDRQIQNAPVGDWIRQAGLKKKSRLELAEALVRRLHNQIRYTGVEYGEASIVPRTPAEILQRKYGDCKDTAAFLVALFRAAGVPAYLALLNTSVNHETAADLPGLGAFDHAIVYAPGQPDLWIDTTAEFSRVTQLPAGDQNRLALVVRPETTGLVPTPEAVSTDNRTLETREFFLSEMGPARVVETTETWGSVESGYRNYYADGDPKEIRKQLESYVKEAYVSEELKGVEHPDANDFSKHFHLKLEMLKAERGTTDQASAAVGIWLKEIAARLPHLKPSDDEGEPADSKEKSVKKRQSPLLLPEPFQTEWRYRITPPPGFQPRALPENKTEQWGVATFSQEFATAPDGIVTATFRLDSGPRRQTAEQAEALRAGVEELRQRKVLLINFDQVGQAHLAAGRIREALTEFRKLVELHPKEALHHTQVARALLAAGIGEAARTQARLATENEPSAASAYQVLGWVLQHDLVGRRFGKGFDREGAVAAYRKALEIEPDNFEAHGDLAILLEHDAKGRRYSRQAQLPEAITEYRAIEAKVGGTGIENNLPIALMWAQRYTEMNEAAQKLKNAAVRHQIALVFRAATEGSQAALQEATSIADAEARRAALSNAGSLLMQLRLYPQAVDLLTAGAQGTPRAAAVAGLVGILKRAKRHEELNLPEADPRSAAQRFMIALLSPDEEPHRVLELLSPHAREQMLKEYEDLQDLEKMRNSFRNSIRDLPLPVVLDILLALMDFVVEGNQDLGYRVQFILPGQKDDSGLTLYLMHEDGKLCIVEGAADKEEVVMLGLLALERAERGDLPGARQLLDWARQDIPLGGGDDPLAGAPFPRFWTRGAEADLQTVRSSAASLMVKEKPAEKALPILREARANATSKETRAGFDLAMARALSNLEQHDELREVASRLLEAFPDSATAFEHLTAALARLGRLEELERSAGQRLERLPNDPAAIRALANTSHLKTQHGEAMQQWGQLVALGKSKPQDLNRYAWEALLAGTATQKTVETFQRAAFLPKEKEKDQEKAEALFTLAALFAELEKTTEARTSLLQAMNTEGLEEPDSKSWYVFGRIAEQYGEPAAAAAAYRQVKPPKKQGISIANSAYLLAQRRLDQLIKEKKVGAS